VWEGDQPRMIQAARWMGRVYRGDFENTNGEDYWNAPWEINAYGREWRLYKKFMTHMKKSGRSVKRKRRRT